MKYFKLDKLSTILEEYEKFKIKFSFNRLKQKSLFLNKLKNSFIDLFEEIFYEIKYDFFKDLYEYQKEKIENIEISSENFLEEKESCEKVEIKEEEELYEENFEEENKEEEKYESEKFEEEEKKPEIEENYSIKSEKSSEIKSLEESKNLLEEKMEETVIFKSKIILNHVHKNSEAQMHLLNEIENESLKITETNTINDLNNIDVFFRYNKLNKNLIVEASNNWKTYPYLYNIDKKYDDDLIEFLRKYVKQVK